MFKNSYENWKEKSIKDIKLVINSLTIEEHFILNLIESAYAAGYYDGLETQETKTAEYNWNKWNQK